MININDIGDILNNYLKDKVKGFFVINKTTITNPTFKAIKNINIDIWYVNGKYYKDKKKIFTLNHSDKILLGQEEKVDKIIINKLLLGIFKFIDNKEYLKL